MSVALLIAASLACEVWARETSFAQSVADHDAATFAAHLHPDAVFVGGNNRGTHGADAIARANGTTPKLRCTATGVALKVNPDGVPVPDQGPATRVR